MLCFFICVYFYLTDACGYPQSVLYFIKCPESGNYISLMAAWAATYIEKKSVGFQQLRYFPVEIRGDLLGLVEHIVFSDRFFGGSFRGNTALAA